MIVIEDVIIQSWHTNGLGDFPTGETVWLLLQAKIKQFKNSHDVLGVSLVNNHGKNNKRFVQ